jgi:hypothetical protein
MNTKNSLTGYLVVAAVFVLMIGTSSSMTGAAGPVIKQERQVGPFSGLEIGGAFHVYLSQGERESLVIEAEEGDLDRIITEVVGNNLRIHTKNWNNCHGPLNIYLTFKDLKYIDLSGAVDVTAENPLKFSQLELEISGAADVELPFTAEKLTSEISGASEVDLEGECEYADLEISGATEFSAMNFRVTNMNLELSGASDAKVHVTGELIVEASGASSVSYKGNPKVMAETSGASSIKGD